MLREQVQKELGRRLVALGFRRGGSTFRREADHGIEVFGIQGSRFGGGTFYLNVGVYVGGDEHHRATDAPMDHDCQLRDRIPHEGKTEKEVLDAILAWFAARATPPAPVVRDPLPRVSHARFGPGTVRSDRGGSYEIAFDDGTLRVVAKRFLTQLDLPAS